MEIFKRNKVMKLIDKDAVLAEIERLGNVMPIDEFQPTERDKICWLGGKEFCINSLYVFLDSLEVKEVDLDNFIKEEFNKYSCVDGYGQLSVSYNMAEFYGMIKRLTKAQKGEEV